MQAVRVDRRNAPDPRWLRHILLLSGFSLLLSWVVTARPQDAAQLVDRLPIAFLAPPSAPAHEWRPVRVPVRTSSVRDAQTPSVGAVPPTAVEAAPPQVGARPGETIQAVQWVQAHKPTRLLAAPDHGAPTALEVPQWAHLRLLEWRPDWLQVGYGADGEGRPARVAWISGYDVGPAGPPPRFVTSTKVATLWSENGAGAAAVASVPKLAPLERADQDANGRVAVRFAAATGTTTAWIDADAVKTSSGPAERDVPLGRAFSPFETAVRLSVPFRTQLDGSLSSGSNCGPASISMALESFGISIPITQARALATRQMGVFSPWTGTTLESLRHVAEANGLEGLDLNENGRYKRWTLDDVRRHLRAGHPVIPQLRYRLIPGHEWSWASFDHYVVLTGLDGDNFVYNDPATIGSGQGVMSDQALLRAWMGSDHPGAALAVARPL